MLGSFALNQMSPFNLRSSDHKCDFCSVFDRTHKLNILTMQQKEQFLLRKERKTWPLEYAHVSEEWNSFTAGK